MSKRLMIVAAIAVAFGFTARPSTADAGRNSGWGWAKPINQRLGAFYTSNRAHHRKWNSSSYRSNTRSYKSTGRSTWAPTQPRVFTVPQGWSSPAPVHGPSTFYYRSW